MSGQIENDIAYLDGIFGRFRKLGSELYFPRFFFKMFGIIKWSRCRYHLIDENTQSKDSNRAIVARGALVSQNVHVLPVTTFAKPKKRVGVPRTQCDSSYIFDYLKKKMLGLVDTEIMVNDLN